MTDGEARGIVGAAAETMARVPPILLGVLLLNVVFVGGLVWLFAQQSASRERALAPLLHACANSVPMDALKLLYKPDARQ